MGVVDMTERVELTQSDITNLVTALTVQTRRVDDLIGKLTDPDMLYAAREWRFDLQRLTLRLQGTRKRSFT